MSTRTSTPTPSRQWTPGPHATAHTTAIGAGQVR